MLWSRCLRPRRTVHGSSGTHKILAQCSAKCARRNRSTRLGILSRFARQMQPQVCQPPRVVTMDRRPLLSQPGSPVLGSVAMLPRSPGTDRPRATARGASGRSVSPQPSSGRARQTSVAARRRWAKVRSRLPLMTKVGGSLFYLLNAGEAASGGGGAADSDSDQSTADPSSAGGGAADGSPGSTRASHSRRPRIDSHRERTARVKLAARFVQDAVAGQEVRLTQGVVRTRRKQVCLCTLEGHRVRARCVQFTIV